MRLINFVVCLLIPLQEGYSDEAAPSVDAATELYTRAGSKLEAGEVCSRIFDSSEFADIPLTQYLSCDNTSLAVQAAWRLHHRIVPGNTLADSDDRDVFYPPDHQRFIGFVEGRIRSVVPLWWASMLSSSDQQHPTRTGLPTSTWIAMPYSTDIGVRNDVPIIVDGLQILISRELFGDEYENQNIAEYSAVMEKSLVVLLLRPRQPGELRLICIDHSINKMVWKQPLWGAGPGIVATGAPFVVDMANSLHMSNGKVVVFGSQSRRTATSRGDRFRNSVLYFEQFELREGECTARFATNAWDSDNACNLEVPE